MYWIAFMLGMVGSLHCIGMCGPLALGVCAPRVQNGLDRVLAAVFYNLGRTFSYIGLGVLFGLLGTVATLSGVQRWVSIGMGIVLILMGVFTQNPEQLINRFAITTTLFRYISSALGKVMQLGRRIPTFLAGLVNGVLPCGMVYIALAGAVSLSNVWGSAGFMLFFGLGTLPTMTVLILSPTLLGHRTRSYIAKLYPWVSMALGAYLVYRGMMTKLPIELDFFEAMRHPIMCH